MVKWRKDDGSINWPNTDEEWCEWFTELETIYIGERDERVGRLRP